MSKINVRSRFNGKPKSLPRRQSQRNLSSNSDYINNEKLQFSSSDENENVNPSFSTQVNKSPMVMRECTENFNSASEDNSSKTDSNKASESYSNIHSLIPISRNKSKYELPSNVPEISNNCKIEENVQKQKSSHFKENLSSDKISPNKKCTKVKGKSPDRRKTFIISHEKKSLKRETYTISELNSTIASLSKVEDPNSSENSSPIKISNNCDKITSSSVVFENIYNKGLSYVNSNTNLISANENEKLGNNKIEKSRSRLLSHNKGIYESDKNTIKEMRSAIEKSKNHKISTDKKKIDIERNININETKSSSKKNVKFESIKYCHNSDQLVVTNSVDENMLKEISPIVFQTKRRQKSIRRKSLTNKNNETQLPKIDNDIFDECHMKEKLFKNKELTTQIANKELIIQLDDVLTPIKTHSNKTEENYIFITDPLDGSFLKVDTSIKLEENSVNEQNEESQDNIEDINNINDDTESLHREGRKRRAVVGVSYKEPPGNKYDND
ncbi:uncharacterized protein LOC111617706 [Centruroides sculpturatus]|uniref:uncharacterized protein LOC111617706 n=1 Tax=Centruroides sculpturatus TaxID=218467 RepID=UPI000C6D0DCA|nr:uncharacterized protein LOC111617706 [Centruroides sculpturatus]